MSIEAMKLAIEALRQILTNDGGEGSKCYSAIKLYDARILGGEAIKALEAALTQEQGEPVPFNQQVLDEWTAAFKKETDYWKARHDILLNSLKKSGVEPVGEMQLSAIIEGAVVPVVAVELQLPAGTKLYTTPPQRKPLTDEDVWKALDDTDCTRPMLIARAIEAAHGIKE